jgi:hypothetical protein
LPGARHGVGGWRYAFYRLPDSVQGQAVLDRVDAELRTGERWRAVRAGANAYRTWLHQVSGEQVSMVVAGYRPLIMSIGPHRSTTPPPTGSPGPGATPASSSPTTRPSQPAVDEALSIAHRAVLAFQGQELLDQHVLALVGQAQQAFEEWVQREQRAAQLQLSLDTRACPSCGNRCPSQARGCPSCQYRFTAADDAQRDSARAKAVNELRLLKAGGRPPATPPPPPPPSSPPILR